MAMIEDDSALDNSSLVECETIYGEKKLVPKEKLMLRLSAYAILVEDGKMLLVNTRSTGRYFFPGGAVEAGEDPESALRR
jgi:hypothetical protein